MHYFKQMLMPNLSIFITWGLLSIITNNLSGELQRNLLEVNHWLTYLLLPILISYSGAKIFNQKAAVAGAIASLGMIVVSDFAPIFGAMVIGLLTGSGFQWLYKWVSPRIKPGYEMLVNNLLVGVSGGLTCIMGILIIQPVVERSLMNIGALVYWLIEKNLLPFISLIIEPLKIFFLNNVINHGILTPLGLELSQKTGHSILFLMEANPGPGVGVLAAMILFAEKEKSIKASGALMIQAIGGIHEIYFPFVLMQPALFFAVILGGATGTLTFQWLDIGLSTPVSPGSLVVILANTPPLQILGVTLGIFLSALVTFTCASILLKKHKPTPVKSTSSKKELSMNNESISEIIFACDAGMGSSAMGAALLQKQLAFDHIRIPITYRSIAELKKNPEQLVVVQENFLPLAKEKVEDSQILPVTHFLEIDEYLPLIKQRINNQPSQELAKQTVQSRKGKVQKVVFLYEKNRRGSQTMGMIVLSRIAKEHQVFLDIQKEAIEQLIEEEQILYVTDQMIAKNYSLEERVKHLLIVDHFVGTQEYAKLVKEVDIDVFVTQREATTDRTHH
ncbi:PTS sugar transporter subunit IIC [Enterococcus hirae]|nr:PTS transporter subunit EIIC [Enterococcus sp. 10A9_DIV0425]THE10238.1 PTS sugar transporter subunit IIC [Enterococcus hirae]